jgi:hypothetical protein
LAAGRQPVSDCANERLLNDCSHWSKGKQFELQKAIAIAFPGATGLRNKAYREFWGTILELKRRAAVA